MDDKMMEKVDLYELLGLTIDATLKQIKSAYRKKSLKYHPDKNPDNPQAAELFDQLSKALKILTDEKSRAEYDRKLRAKEAAKLRHKELDSRRQKFKDDLELREEAARLESLKRKNPEEKFEDKMKRLEKEGKKLLKEELAKVYEEPKYEEDDNTDYKLKVSWDKGKEPYNETVLRKILSKYGDIQILVVSAKKPTAIVEYSIKDAAVTAYQLEKGLLQNPLTMSWVDKKKKNEKKAFLTVQNPKMSDMDDFERMVLLNMKRAEERKKLETETQEQDFEEET